MNEGFDPNVVAEYERDTWARCADSYLDTFSGITQETVSLLVEGGEIRSGSKVLDIGSGPGHIASHLTKLGASVTGVDFSPRMVEVARKKYPQITFEQADAEELPFEAGYFDTVVANYVVHHLARPEKVLSEVYRVLKPGGRFAFAVWGPPEDQSSIGAFFSAVEAHHDLAELPHGPLFGIVSRDVFEPMLAAAGLETRELAVHATTWRTDSLDPVLLAFWDWGNMASLPSETQGNIERTMRVNSQPFRRDGKYVFPHSALVGSARKI